MDVPEIVIVRVEPEQDKPERDRKCPIAKPIFYMEKEKK